MSHRSSGEDKARVNGNARHRHSGLTARIREALAAGPMTMAELSAVLKAPRHNVQSMIGQLMAHGGVTRDPMSWPPRYRLFTEPVGSASKVAPKTCPECESTTLIPDYDHFQCGDCGARFLKSGAPRVVKKKKSGSGVIAGRLFIRGYLW